MGSRQHQRPDRPPTEIEWGKLAAYIDGEGCIRLERVVKKEKPNWNPSYSVCVVVSNSDPRLPLWCKRTFGGYITNLKDKRVRATSKLALFCWRVSTKDSKWVLDNCLEHFIIKRQQAEIALAMYETFPAIKYSQWEPVPREVIAKRDSLVVSISELKKSVPSFEEALA